jgi:hypothetical protein
MASEFIRDSIQEPLSTPKRVLHVGAGLGLDDK